LKILAWAIALLVGGLLVAATADFPAWGDPNSAASVHLSPHFIEKTMQETSVPNIVTAVLADYRGYDTMFETAVIFTAGLACFFLLRSLTPDGKKEHRFYRHTITNIVVEVKNSGHKTLNPELFQEIDGLWTPHDAIVTTVCRLFIPFIQLFGLYVIAHGHHSPGGGFQGGVILGASMILLAISHDLRTAAARLNESQSSLLSAAGVFIYAGVGAACLAMGANFLDYSSLAPLQFVDPVQARSLGILYVEIGVGIAVMSTMIVIYKNLASAGRFYQGL
jgi:multicomponent Na+:H+ antiporter subunit B